MSQRTARIKMVTKEFELKRRVAVLHFVRQVQRLAKLASGHFEQAPRSSEKVPWSY